MLGAIIDQLLFRMPIQRGESTQPDKIAWNESKYDVVQPYAIACVDYPRYARSYPVGLLHEITGYDYSSGYKILTMLRTSLLI